MAYHRRSYSDGVCTVGAFWNQEPVTRVTASTSTHKKSKIDKRHVSSTGTARTISLPNKPSDVITRPCTKRWRSRSPNGGCQAAKSERVSPSHVAAASSLSLQLKVITDKAAGSQLPGATTTSPTSTMASPGSRRLDCTRPYHVELAKKMTSPSALLATASDSNSSSSGQISIPSTRRPAGRPENKSEIGNHRTNSRKHSLTMQSFLEEPELDSTLESPESRAIRKNPLLKFQRSRAKRSRIFCALHEASNNLGEAPVVLCGPNFGTETELYRRHRVVCLSAQRHLEEGTMCRKEFDHIVKESAKSSHIEDAFAKEFFVDVAVPTAIRTSSPAPESEADIDTTDDESTFARRPHASLVKHYPRSHASSHSLKQKVWANKAAQLQVRHLWVSEVPKV
mmetsp:Transcript_11989/g.17350  ORF Transcript_11989/g.17350 Transcript_11989/m.17350 type:complete len:396 (+) Transcript_11989:108-1295(+)|eukprot:CAMPEP_0195518886 /NCGR_PEP_ID=MMETSP0794_2-20130614/13860_1 /TAXON_ID=515487 /ORGANISM="Stephanopyxis turris, Strain CCMP 815" /LENGTH=395 /DNA_ID=CAMNT_0040647923 /DNA_START=108 /DNA_END=1295 /DNA_ORIENTATION=+